MNNSVLVAVGALLVGGAGGYFLGSTGKGETGDGSGADDGRSSKTTRTSVRSAPSDNPGPVRSYSSTKGIREILAEPGQTNRIMSLLQYYSDLDPSQFEAEVQKLQGLPMSQRMLAMNLLFSRWAETDPQAALAQSRTMGFPEMFMARAGVVTGWAASDPEGLARQYTENPEEFQMRGPGARGGGDTVSMIAGEWAKQNPKAALAWARSLEGNEAGEALKGIFNEIAREDPSEALQMAAGLNETERMNAYRSIAETWAVTDYTAVDQWINTLTGEAQTVARREAVQSLASVDPKRAAAEALKLPDGEGRDALIAEVSREWARESPASALEFLVTNGSQEAVQGGIGRVMGGLASQDAVKAREWIDVQPAGPVRDSAVQGYIFGNRDAQPAETIALAESISVERDRENTVQRVAFEWMREDSEAALNYVEASTVLSDETKDRMIEAAEGMAQGGGDGRGFGRGGPGGFGR